MRNPLLRSAGLLNALFHKAVIVTEADADRAFYQEVNERLLSAGDQRGISDCLFLNAQNLHTVWDIVAPLRALGIPAAGIVDIDVIQNAGKSFLKMLRGAHIPKATAIGLEAQRSALRCEFEKTGKSYKRSGGIGVLEKENRESCDDWFKQLARYGAFVVPIGEVEAWLETLKVPREKEAWLANIFERMGEDPAASGYVAPSPGDVWDFIGNVGAWLRDANRAGVPVGDDSELFEPEQEA
jgi:hypothetical protein